MVQPAQHVNVNKVGWHFEYKQLIDITCRLVPSGRPSQSVDTKAVNLDKIKPTYCKVTS